MKVCSFCAEEIQDTATLCPHCQSDLTAPISLIHKPERRVTTRRQTPIDDHGQPVSGFLNRRRRSERDISEMLGLAKGMLADGTVNEEEARYLREWGTNHPDAVSQWPASLIFARLAQFFRDGMIDERERLELRDLLAQLIGGTTSLVMGYEASSTLPLDKPAPLICWGPNEVYVFTGKFAYGTREHCEREVIQRGSRCEKNVTRRTSFLVLGTFGSEDWAHTSYGRKIEKAVELRHGGFAIRIVGEDHWAQSLSR